MESAYLGVSLTRSINELVSLSRYAGLRPDLAQGGGGNASVKMPNGQMHIKASGYALADVRANSGYSTLDLHALQGIWGELSDLPDRIQREKLASEWVSKALIPPSLPPSIETLVHAILGPVVLHTHALAANALTWTQEGQRTLQLLFPEAVLVGYETPGVDLAMRIRTRQSSLYFLQNHGLIVTGKSGAEVMALNEEVVSKLEQRLGMNFNSYRHAAALIELVDPNLSGHLSRDVDLLNLVQQRPDLLLIGPCSPDTAVYCGFELVSIERSQDTSVIEQYRTRYHEPPKVLLYNNNLIFLGASLKKAQEAEQVFKAHLTSLAYSPEVPQPLPQDELTHLSRWEAEKYRMAL